MRWQNVETPTFEGSAGSNGEPAVVETMTLVDRDGAEVMTVTKAVDGVKSIDVGGSEVTATQLANLITYGNPTGVKVYRALLTQTGTDAPVATVRENTLGGTVVWTWNNNGEYDATLAGAFTVNATVASGLNIVSNDDPGNVCSMQAYPISINAVRFRTMDTGLPTDLHDFGVEILVYPS
jgi:hypothetical protein